MTYNKTNLKIGSLLCADMVDFHRPGHTNMGTCIQYKNTHKWNICAPLSMDDVAIGEGTNVVIVDILCKV